MERSRILIDSTGLGYSARDRQIMVHYPTRALRDARGNGASCVELDYNTSWPIGPVPPSYGLEPPNAITAERVALWAALLAAANTTRGQL